MEGLSREEELTMTLLSVSLSEGKRLDERHTERILWNRVLILAEEHEVMSYLYPAMPPETPKEVLDVIRLRARQIVQKYYRMFFLMKHTVSLLEKEGVSLFVLRGIAASLAYPVPEYRSVKALALFIPAEEDFARAAEILQQNGFFRDPMNAGHRCTVFHHPEGLPVELHRSFMETEDEEFQSRLKVLTDELMRHVNRVDFLGVKIPVLSPPYQAVSLLLHMWKHYNTNGFSLRLLCDWTAFWRRKLTEGDRRDYLALAEQLGLTSFSEFMTAICTEELGLPAGHVHSHLIRSKAAYASFLKELFETGEFGDEESRMELIKGEGPVDQFRELHHRMRVRFPKASGVFLCWPPLWVATWVGTLKENREVRL